MKRWKVTIRLKRRKDPRIIRVTGPATKAEAEQAAINSFPESKVESAEAIEVAS